MYGGLCTVVFGLVKNGENRALAAVVPGKVMEGSCVATEGGWRRRIKEVQRGGGGWGGLDCTHSTVGTVKPFIN